MDTLKKIAHKVSNAIYRRIILYRKINFIKTFYFNFKKFPFNIAIKFPVIFYGRVKFQCISGEVVINGLIRTAMIGYGQLYEQAKRSKGTAELNLKGRLVFNGSVSIGKDVFLFVGENAYCELGHMSCLGSDVKLVCTDKIIIGDWTGVGYESQIIDTNSHPMKNTLTGEFYPITGSINIGSHNAISNRVSIMAKTQTPDYCVVASNTVCNKDYTSFGSNILIGGIPARLLKINYSRDWEGEKELLKKYRTVKL